MRIILALLLAILFSCVHEAVAAPTWYHTNPIVKPNKDTRGEYYFTFTGNDGQCVVAYEINSGPGMRREIAVIATKTSHATEEVQSVYIYTAKDVNWNFIEPVIMRSKVEKFSRHWNENGQSESTSMFTYDGDIFNPVCGEALRALPDVVENDVGYLIDLVKQ
ncbi:MAG: hypothetical protein WCT49_01170 [Candidatus Paceibacterota bacterium]|nr:hypothetical protein [Candidatus Paceibacterota bacterium]